jgi:hypothetical protein
MCKNPIKFAGKSGLPGPIVGMLAVVFAGCGIELYRILYIY